jgi:predicted alpha-1,6-mannanase (GH76 family)
MNASPPALAFSAQDATDIWSAYNQAFYAHSHGPAFYRKEHGGQFDVENFWFNAEELEMAVDRASRSGSAEDQAILASLIEGFDHRFTDDWTKNIYNDDLMWACLAHLRAYLVTGRTHPKWAQIAANNFNWVYHGGHAPGRALPQYDETFGGGMWWITDHGERGTKNACINGPAALAAYYLSVAYPNNTHYLAEAKKMYDWEKIHLVSSSGYVHDHYTRSRGAVGGDLSYNSGTFIGAACCLKDWAAADLAAKYYMNNCCDEQGILPDYGTDGRNNTGFNGIFMRWMAMYMIESHTESTYSKWLYNNANRAWSMRNNANLSWDDWNDNTPNGALHSWDCSPSVVALQVLPPQ